MTFDSSRTEAVPSCRRGCARRGWWTLPNESGSASTTVRSPASPTRSPFVPGLLLVAMALGEELVVDGPVSPRLLRGVARVKAVYRSWWPEFADVPVRAEAGAPQGQGGLTASLFTRGVDSWYSAVTGVAGGANGTPHPVDTLLYVPSVDFARGEQGSGPAEIQQLRQPAAQLSRESAERLGCRLLVVNTNLRHLAEPLLYWGYSHGGVLAACALAIGDRLREVRVPSSLRLGGVACGSHPLVDPLWSTERTEVRHDGAEATRMDKVQLLTGHRLALDNLRVCDGLEPHFNCGRCGKCLRTMVLLDSVGALERCPTFRESLSAWRVARLTVPDNPTRAVTEESMREVRRVGGRPALARALQVGFVRHHAGRAARHLLAIAKSLARER